MCMCACVCVCVCVCVCLKSLDLISAHLVYVCQQSILSQIQHVLSDKDRVIKRTQLKRFDERVLGAPARKRKRDEALPEPSDDMLGSTSRCLGASRSSGVSTC